MKPGMIIKVDRMPVAQGSIVELDRVLLISDATNTTIGSPVIPGAKVKASVREIGKEKKIIVFKYKSKARYRRKNGHRQAYTMLNIEEILLPSAGEAEGAA